jgi:hypothetical protein
VQDLKRQKTLLLLVAQLKFEALMQKKQKLDHVKPLVGRRFWHRAPVVNRARWARWHAGHAQIANLSIHHIVSRVMRDRAHRAGGLAGIATNANLGVDQMLLYEFCGGVHGR